MLKFQTTYHNVRIIIHHDGALITSITDPAGKSVCGALNDSDLQVLQKRLTRHLAVQLTKDRRAVSVAKTKNKTKSGGKQREPSVSNRDITFAEAQQQVLNVLSALPLSSDIVAGYRYPGADYARLHETRNPNIRLAVHWGLAGRRACIVAEILVADTDGDWAYIENHSKIEHVPEAELATYLKYAYTRADDARSAQAMAYQLGFFIDAITKVSDREIRECTPGTIFQVKSVTGDVRHVMLLEPVSVTAKQMVALYTVHSVESNNIVSSTVLRVKLSDATAIVRKNPHVIPIYNEI